MPDVWKKAMSAPCARQKDKLSLVFLVPLLVLRSFSVTQAQTPIDRLIGSEWSPLQQQTLRSGSRTKSSYHAKRACEEGKLELRLSRRRRQHKMLRNFANSMPGNRRHGSTCFWCKLVAGALAILRMRRQNLLSSGWVKHYRMCEWAVSSPPLFFFLSLSTTPSFVQGHSFGCGSCLGPFLWLWFLLGVIPLVVVLAWGHFFGCGSCLGSFLWLWFLLGVIPLVVGFAWGFFFLVLTFRTSRWLSVCLLGWWGYMWRCVVFSRHGDLCGRCYCLWCRSAASFPGAGTWSERKV